MKQIVAAIDFGTSKVVCVIGEKKGYSRFDVIGSGTAKYAGYREGSWLEPEHLEETIYAAVREAEISARHKVKDIYVGVPGDYCRVVCNRSSIKPESRERHITQKDLNRLTARAEEFYRPDYYTVICRCPVYFVLDGKNRVIDPVGMKASELSGVVSYVLADKFFLEDVHVVLQTLGMNVCEFMPVPVAVGMMMIPPEERDKMVALVDVGYYSTNLSILEGDGVVFHETIGIGGVHITSDIAYGMETSMAEAETLKRKYAFMLAPAADGSMITAVDENDHPRNYNMQALQIIIESRVEELVERLQQSIDGSGYRLGSRSSLYMTGGGIALMRGCKQFLHMLMERQINVLTPHAGALNTPGYSSAIALLDQAFGNSQEPQGGFLAWAKNLFG